mgnify:CR=1 FL=1
MTEPEALARLERVEWLVQRWYQDAAKPSKGTDYDTGQYDALIVCISQLQAVLTGGGLTQWEQAHPVKA